jgi:hypothetical protein
MEALLAHCHEGTPPPEEQIQQLWELAQQAEPAVQPYLKECACCFAAGAYSAAIVTAWCAIARYLRLVVEAVGVEVARLYYKQEESEARQPFSELTRRSDKPFYITYRRMRLFEDRFTDNVNRIDNLYTKRCQYAHPTGKKAGLQEAVDYVAEAKWLLTRRLEQERFQNISVVMECAKKDSGLNLSSEEKTRQLVFRVREDQRESLAFALLRSLVSEQRDIVSESALALWDEVKPLLQEDSRRRLMDELAFGLSRREIDRSVHVMVVAEHLVFWEAATQPAIWEYFVVRRGDLSERVKRSIRQHAPSPYREQMDEPFE